MITERKPLWTQDEAIAFEVARDAINAVMSIYTGQIAVEERKAEPNVAAIAGLAARLSALHRERTGCMLKTTPRWRVCVRNTAPLSAPGMPGWTLPG